MISANCNFLHTPFLFHIKENNRYRQAQKKIFTAMPGVEKINQYRISFCNSDL